MDSYDFIDSVLDKSILANRQAEREREGSVFLASLDTDADGIEVLVTKDPQDRGSKYSGIGFTTSPYVACDRCGWARGYRPGAYKVSVKGKMTVKVVCHACVDHWKRKGSERPAHRFGKNKEAKQFQKLMSYRKKDDPMDVDEEVDKETGGPAAPGIDDEKPT